MSMPIPTRARPEPQVGVEAVSKIPGARLHQRTTSSAVPQVAKPVTRTHQRATSLIPKQAKVGEAEPYPPSLLRKPSVRSSHYSTTRQTPTSNLQPPRQKAGLPSSATSASSLTDNGPRQPLLKPQFTAYQQHFSPRKPPRPASTASETPSSNDGEGISHDSPGIRLLRDELLQLQLMHSGSQATLRQFESDARLKLESRFNALTNQNEAILALEKHRDRCTSHTALRAWLPEGDEARDNKLQQLATCLRDLDSLTAENGAYSSSMNEFQTWFEHMIIAIDTRTPSQETTNEKLLFVEPIDPSWLQEVARIQRKLENLRQTLHDLGVADAGGIRFILSSYQGLANNMYAELETCVSIHGIALEQDKAWIEKSLKNLLEGEITVAQQPQPIHRKGIWDAHATEST
jgi:hypothetical protein